MHHKIKVYNPGLNEKKSDSLRIVGIRQVKQDRSLFIIK